jgi:hypothetical protein
MGQYSGVSTLEMNKRKNIEPRYKDSDMKTGEESIFLI